MMISKHLVLALVGAASLAICTTNGSYAAGGEDKKWIARCISDNKNEGAKESVVRVYCECMVDKMEDSETQTVTQWEKTHVTERKACDKEAGWK
ncbi:MAG: hypothetical protein QOC72_571 [Methylobacteriaceae bacterium]|jgi:hypothetical protein|nr:hypothetical protein [Methylobacteriaceae bacterium]